MCDAVETLKNVVGQTKAIFMVKQAELVILEM
jgi:hypothetical protein